MTAEGVLDSRLLQALVAGLVVAAGWLVNGWQNRRDAARLRAEKLRDHHRAIYAEIETNLSNLWSAEAIRQHGTAIVEKMRADRDFVPFVPREAHDRLFETVTGELSILPRVTIDPIVKYYAQIASVAALAEDMRGAGFRSLPQDRRITIFEDYTEMRVQALHFGRDANRLIAVYAESGKDAAEAEAARLNTRRADRSGP